MLRSVILVVFSCSVHIVKRISKLKGMVVAFAALSRQPVASVPDVQVSFFPMQYLMSGSS